MGEDSFVVGPQVISRGSHKCIGSHCMRNLALQTLSKLMLVAKIKDLLQSLYTCFSHSNKRCQELANVANIMKHGARDCSATSRHARYWSCICKVCAFRLSCIGAQNASRQYLNVQAKYNLVLLCDLECLLGLACLTPMIQALDYLIKFSQAWNCFIRDMGSSENLPMGFV